MSEPTFPPLMSGQAVTGNIDPFEKACAMANKASGKPKLPVLPKIRGAK